MEKKRCVKKEEESLQTPLQPSINKLYELTNHRTAPAGHT